MVWGLFPADPLSGGEKYYIFAKGTYRVGRKGCDIIINNDKGVSRVHAEITFDSVASLDPPKKRSQIRIKDCSKYGTSIKTELGTIVKVQESLNKEATLNDGDVVVFGTGAAAYSQECTHVLVDQKLLSVSETLVDAVIAKKPIVSFNWIELLGQKNICNEIPRFNQYTPSLIVEGASIEIVDPKSREKCLDGYIFVMGPTHEYKFGDRLLSLLEVSAAKAISVEELYSCGQDSEYGEGNNMIYIIPKGSPDKSDRFKKLSALNRVTEMSLLCAVLSGNLSSSALISPAVVVSSSCSTDETVVADSDAEVETATSVEVVSIEESPRNMIKSKIQGDIDASNSNDIHAMISKGSTANIFDESKNVARGMSPRGDKGHEDESQHISKDVTTKADEVDSSRSEIMGVGGGVFTSRSDVADEPGLNSDIIYSQELIVRDPVPISTDNSQKSEVVNFKRFRKKNTQPGNSFSSLIPFSKYPYKESETKEMINYMQEEKKKRRMEAIAEDLFNTEKGRKSGKIASLHRYLGRGT